MKLDALDHPKTFDFASRLGVELPTAIGHLELLWAFAAKQSPQGNIGKWPDGAIARACYWMGPPDDFLKSLLKSGLIDANKAHRFVIHDWSQHCPNWVRAKLKKIGAVFIATDAATEDRTEEATEDGNAEPSTRGRVPSHAMPSHAMPKDPSASATPMKLVPRETLGWFLEFKLAYPERTGDPGWRKAERAANARIAEGHTPEDFLSGAKRYAAYCLSTATEPQYVKQASTFLGPDKPFLLPWKVPANKAERQLDSNISAGLSFLAGGQS